MNEKDLLIFHLARVQNFVRARLNRAFANAGLSISPVQARLLFILRRKHPLSMGELARVLSTDNAAVTRLAEKLVCSGHVTRTRPPGDRRSYLLHPTEVGLAEIQKAEELILQVNEEIRAFLTPVQQDGFRHVLKTIEEALDKEAPPAETALDLDFHLEGLEELCVPHALW
ncbi:MAG: MarR family transcriptional regulator [Thermodesulfobacteriota bacterium]